MWELNVGNRQNVRTDVIFFINILQILKLAKK